MSKFKLPHLIYFFFLCFPLASYSSVYQSLTINEVISDSEFVFEGKVIDLEYKTPTDRNRMYTYITFQINDIIKGNYTQETIEIRYPGGKNGDQIEQVTDMIIPQVGEEGIYFVKSLIKHYIHPLTGWAQGQMNIETDPSGKKRVYSTSGESISGINPRIPTPKKDAQEDFNSNVPLGIRTSKHKQQAMSVDDVKTQLKGIINSESEK